MIPLPYNKINHCLKAQLSPMQMSFVWGSLNQINLFIYFCATLGKHMWAHLLPFKTFKSLHRHLDSKQMREGSPIFTLLLPPLCFYMFFYMLNWFQQLLANCVCVPSGAEYMQCWVHQSWNNKSCSCSVVQCGTFRLSQLKMRYFYSKLLRLSKFNKNCTQKHSNHHASQETRPLLFSVINSAGQQLWRMCNCRYDVLKSNCAVSQWLGISEVN